MVGRKAMLPVSTVGRFDVFVPTLAIANAWSLQPLYKFDSMLVVRQTATSPPFNITAYKAEGVTYG